MKEQSLSKINYFLILLLSGILFVIIFVSVFFICSKDEVKINEYRKVDNPVNLQKSVDYSVFSDFGRLRTFTADNPQIPVVGLGITLGEFFSTPEFDTLEQELR